MSSAVLVALCVVALLLYGVYRLLKWIFKCIRAYIRKNRRVAELEKVEHKAAMFKASIAGTRIISRQKIFDSNRKYHYETTFMIYFKDETKVAITVNDGSHQYDALLSKLIE